MKVFEKQLTVTEEHLDFNNHVNNLVYMQWALDISREHWLSEISDAINEQYFWMVRTHHVEYSKQAFLGDEITVKTFVEGYRGPFSDRVVKIFKGDDLLVEVKSNWCLIARDTQKLKRVPEEIQCLFK
ncbi:MAG: thioesterase family protein [Ekhidna sp.]